ncbi:transglutaminase-like domain-containing protein [Tenacibaculum sp. E3R01]|uniref:transglutaminase-like domain-containing protein n=1 Tax=Tenacibaculum sp. E3R01 TaxID=2267227 RepID=UPI001F276ED0|nr:transglutaminase-like domain-containing protein [Tenacibaculum sp. E3R01]
MKFQKNKIILILLVLLINQYSFSQFSADYKKYKEIYPKESSVILNKEVVLIVDVKKSNLVIKQKVLEERLFLNESAKYNSKESLKYSHFYGLEDIEASSFLFNKKKNKYKEIKVKDFKEKDELTDVFYDDTKSINFIYSNLLKGGKSKLSYTKTIKNPRFLLPFYFGDSDPIINNKITVIVNKDIDIDFVKNNFLSEKLNYSKSEKRNKIIHKWELLNSKGYEYEQKSPSFRKIIPHIIPIIKSFNHKGEKKSILNNVNDLYSWYYSMIENTNKIKPNKELENLVFEITKNKKTELEKVKAIYYWVQQNIKYVAFEYALGGFIPREANDVFNKKFGDCKDNSSILQVMLQIIGVKGYITWIGTNEIPYTYKKVPSPLADNHMILTYEFNENTYFLDATGRYNDLSLPTSFIQGKEALISKGKNEFVIKKVPIISSKTNAIIDTTHININGNVINGTSKFLLKGYYKTNYFNYLERKKNNEEVTSFYNRQLQKGNNSFLISNLKEENKFTYDKNFKLSFDFKVKDYVKNFENEIYVNLNLNKDLLFYKLEDDRKNAVEYEFKPLLSYQTFLKIPHGYKIDYLPENIEVKNSFFKFSINYQKEKDQINYTQELEVFFINLSLKEQKELNKKIEEIEKHYKEFIILKKA